MPVDASVLSESYMPTSQCHRIRSSCSPLEKSVTRERQTLVERKIAFNQNTTIWGDSASPETFSRSSTGPWMLFKGEREVISVDCGDMGVRVLATPAVCRLVCRLADSSRSFLRYHLVLTVCPWAPRRHLVICYLFFSSASVIYGKNQQSRQGTVWSQDLKDVLGSRWVERGVPGLEVSDRTEGASSKELFLPKATYRNVFPPWYTCFRESGVLNQKRSPRTYLR